METKRFAIVNGVKTAHKATAVCEVWTYDVWGDEEDGFGVNNKFCVDREYRATVTAEVSNLPLHPGAKDDFRSWSGCSSFSAEVCVSFCLDDEHIREVFGADAVDDNQGDGEVCYVEHAETGEPIGEIWIVGWEPIDD